jgi:hypothetical protein
MHGLELLKKGLIWHIGEGRKVQVWRNPWVPRPSSRRTMMKKGRLRLKWISQLMILGWREWDFELLRTYMYDHDIDQVKKLWLSNTLEDIVAWHYERHGLFSVRSAYRLAL